LPDHHDAVSVVECHGWSGPTSSVGTWDATLKGNLSVIQNGKTSPGGEPRCSCPGGRPLSCVCCCCHSSRCSRSLCAACDGASAVSPLLEPQSKTVRHSSSSAACATSSVIMEASWSPSGNTQIARSVTVSPSRSAAQTCTESSKRLSISNLCIPVSHATPFGPQGLPPAVDTCSVEPYRGYMRFANHSVLANNSF
jgi:hypothetical protein